MGTAASSPSEAAVTTDQPDKEGIQHATAADAPAASPAEAEVQSSALAPASDALGGGTEAAGETVVLVPAAESGEEDEGECAFCIYMKGGECKEEFVGWEKCVETGGGDIVERCSDAMTALRSCMEKYPDYYAPVHHCTTKDLEAEGEQGNDKKQAEQVVKERKEDPAP